MRKTADFDLPIRQKRDGSFKIPAGETVWTCFSSDFFVEDADVWRVEAWDMIRARSDLDFLFITKRPERFHVSLPDDWGDGWPNVTVCCTVENQKRADERLPMYIELPIRRKVVICEPLLGPIDLSRWLGPWFSHVVAGGESGETARVCDYRWVLSLREQCDRAGIGIYFKQTGARFLKDGTLYRVKRRFQHPQARKAGIDTVGLNG